MRPTYAASLLLSPMLLVASAVASQPKTDVASAQTPRISSGVTAPALLDQNSFHIPAAALGQDAPSYAKVVVAVNVDEKGNAQSVRVLQSANRDLDTRVVDAVLHSHFRPAKLDNQAIPVKLDLEVTVQR